MAATPEEAGHYVMTIFKRHNAVKGETLLIANLTLPFSQDGWTLADYEVGSKYAVDQGWITLGKSEKFFKITEAGIAAMPEAVA